MRAHSRRDPGRSTHRPWLAGGEALIAVSAFAGAVALATGLIDFGSSVNSRFPFASPVFGGVALAAVVGVPMALGALMEWQGSRRANAATLIAGVLLVGWIVVEVAVIRSFSWLQPTLLVAGLGIAVAGCRRVAGVQTPSS